MCVYVYKKEENLELRGEKKKDTEHSPQIAKLCGFVVSPVIHQKKKKS